MNEIYGEEKEMLHLMQLLCKKVFKRIEKELANNGNSKLYFDLCEIEMNLLCSIRHLNNITQISRSHLDKEDDNLK